MSEPNDAGKYQIDNDGTVQGQVVGDHNITHQHFYATQDKTTSSTTKPQRIWNIPYLRNDYFTGRQEILEQLHTRFKANNATALSQRHAMSGLGGIGKTQTAVEYAYRYHQEYQAVLWARAESHETLTSSFVEIAQLLDLPQKDEQDQTLTVNAVKRWLQGNNGWLLILDNADEPKIVREFLPTKFDGHILLTTRAQALGGLAQRIEVDTFTPELGALFLLRRATIIAADGGIDDAVQSDCDRAMQINKELGGLPLALDQAGAYIEETSCSLSEYQSLYRTRRAEMLKERGSLMGDHPEPVATTWSLSFQRIEEKNATAADLLRLCAFMAPDAIPEEILMKGAFQLDAMLGSALADPFLFTQAIEILRAASLLKRDPRTHLLSVHRLVQTVLRNDMGRYATQYWTEQAIKMVTAALPAPRAYLHQQPTWERLLAHALTCAELAWRDNLHTIETVSLLQRTSAYLDWCYRDKEAQPLLERSLVMSAKAYGKDCLEIVDSLYRLAIIYQRQDRYKEAESLFLRALTIHKQHSGPEHPNTAESLNMLASCYRKQDRYEETESLYQQALIIYEQQLGPEHLDTAQIILNLATLYEKQGRNEEARPLFLRAFTIYKQYQEDNNSNAPFFKNLGYLYFRQSMYIEAEASFQHEVTAWEIGAGPEHLTTIVGLQDLIFLYEKLGKYEQAEPLYLRALTICEQQLGPLHPDTAKKLNNLAMFYYDQGKYEQAEPLHMRALAIYKTALGSQHSDTQQTRQNYATLLRAMGRDEEAKQLEEKQ